MPRENRKRGKKHKKRADEDADFEHKHQPAEEEQNYAEVEEPGPSAGPSWIVPAQERSDYNAEAPFGYVDAEVKAYFRTVDVQIREWQEQGAAAEAENGDVDPNEDRRLFFVAALTETSGKEKQLATDPDCSTILERMTYSMDDFVRRVFIDKLDGSFDQLVTHRFASHVCQTLLSVASETVSRETRGILPKMPESSEEDGELRTLTQLVLDVSEELLPPLSDLVRDPFASHVIRALLLLLDPDSFSSTDAHTVASNSHGALRSKKSTAYKAKQGPMRSVFKDNEDARQQSKAQVPQEFRDMAVKFVKTLRGQVDGNAVRTMGVNNVASPVLQMLLEVEAAHGLADSPGSLMDHALHDLITTMHSSPDSAIEPSDYVNALFRDQTASHLLEILVRRSPDNAFSVIWDTYFCEKLNRLAVHPVANFVVAKALKRIGADQVGVVCKELGDILGKIIKNGRTGVLRALVDRAATLHAHEDQVVQTVCDAFELTDSETESLAVPCILRLLTPTDYKAVLVAQEEKTAKADSGVPKKRARMQGGDDPLEPKTQGAVLLQSMLRLSNPHNDIVLDSVLGLEAEKVIEMAHHVTSSRVLDVVLDSPTVPTKTKRKFVQSYIGHYHQLVDDRVGSRVGERCWAFADPYLKEKIARSLIPHEHFLAGSFYGKFFARNLNLHLLQRNPEQWKEVQAAKKGMASAPASQQPKSAGTSAVTSLNSPPGEPAPATSKEKRKRKAEPEDEIDALFENALENKVKRGGLVHTKQGEEKRSAGAEEGKKKKTEAADKDLKDIIGAIRTAPKDDGGHHKSKKKRTR